jgi:predicted RNase H-like nuclease (RuvC/YqgF family)
LFPLQHDTQRIIVGQCRRIDTYAREVKSLEQEIECMAQEHGALHQQLRALESHVCDKDHVLLTIYCRSTERDQELHQHRGFLHEAEEVTTAMAREFEDF